MAETVKTPDLKPPTSKKGRRLSRTSIFRLMPAALLALLPFSQIDEVLLGSLYALRGPLKAPEQLMVLTYENLPEAEQAVNTASSRGSKQCVIFLAQEIEGLTTCKHLIIEDFYSSEVATQNFTALEKYFSETEIKREYRYKPLLYGGIEQFPTSSVQRFLSTSPTRLVTNVIVLIPLHYESKVKLMSSAGPLSALEMGLNVLANAYEHQSLMSTSRATQVMAALASLVLVTWILYSYPIFLTLIFSTGLAAGQFAVAALVFDRFGIQLPIAGPLATVIATYLLGMSDRLDRRERREWRLEQESQNLIQLDEMRNNFLSLVSHDLKTPIARMQSSLERFLRGDFGPLNESQQNHLQKILSANGSLQRSISTLLLLSRVESREVHIKFEPTDLTQLLEEVAKAHQATAHDRQIILSLDLEPTFLVNLDQGLIREVATNLIDNAMKYSPAGSQITLRCGEMDNCPELMPPQPGIWFEVQDQGPGIEKEDRKKIFQKFVRGSREKTALDQAVKGTGLGLFLTQYFVEQHNGSVTLFSKTSDEILHPGDAATQYFQESPTQTGTLFRVCLPLDQADNVTIS